MHSSKSKNQPMTKSHHNELGLVSQLILALTLIVLVVLLIGIAATFPTFTHVFLQLELICAYWGGAFLQVVFVVCSLLALATVPLSIWFVVTEIQARKHRLRRFAPSKQGYYEALLLPDHTFSKP